MSNESLNKPTDKAMKIGISACLIGEKVRFDGGNKPSNFCINELGQHVSYVSICPEVAIGLPIPRPTIRQIKRGDTIYVAQPDGTGDVTDALSAYGKKIAEQVNQLSGYIFCAKSPSCGMERVKVYSDNGDPLKANGIGLFASEIMQANPLLPCEENGRLNDPILRENFVARIFAYHRWQQINEAKITKHQLTEFHSCYKYTVMSHDLVAYKALGRLLARADLAAEEMAPMYILGLMSALKINATRKKHANTLSHIQGYFSKNLSSAQRQELTKQIDDYRKGLSPLVAPLTLVNHYLMEYPDPYLAKQVYLNPYPEALKLRYGY